jgi:hypothetical protein
VDVEKRKRSNTLEYVSEKTKADEKTGERTQKMTLNGKYIYNNNYHLHNLTGSTNKSLLFSSSSSINRQQQHQRQ